MPSLITQEKPTGRRFGSGVEDYGKQYSRMEYIVGQKKSDVLDSDERLVIL